jgi:hypothetical protein
VWNWFDGLLVAIITLATVALIASYTLPCASQKSHHGQTGNL